MKNSCIRYRKERIGHNHKEIVIIDQAAGQKMAFIVNSFLTISNALKQFPGLNLITPEAHMWQAFVS
jgi:hypothetical protein